MRLAFLLTIGLFLLAACGVEPSDDGRADNDSYSVESQGGSVVGATETGGSVTRKQLTPNFATAAEYLSADSINIPYQMDWPPEEFLDFSWMAVLYTHPTADALGFPGFALVAMEERGVDSPPQLGDLAHWVSRVSASDWSPDDLAVAVVCGDEVYIASDGPSLDLVIVTRRGNSLLGLRFLVADLPSVVDFVSDVLVDLVWRGEPAFACGPEEIRTALEAARLRSEPFAADSREARAQEFGEEMRPAAEVDIMLEATGAFEVAYGTRPSGPFDWYEWEGYLQISAIEPAVPFATDQLVDLEDRLRSVTPYGRQLSSSEIPSDIYDLVAAVSHISVAQTGSEIDIYIDTTGAMTQAMSEGLLSQLASWLMEAGVDSARVSDS
ncbi:MAG: hypothetical protein GY926_26470 [bacterium]|nr:hypothetical protein [bacterium]